VGQFNLCKTHCVCQSWHLRDIPWCLDDMFSMCRRHFEESFGISLLQTKQEDFWLSRAACADSVMTVSWSCNIPSVANKMKQLNNLSHTGQRIIRERSPKLIPISTTFHLFSTTFTQIELAISFKYATSNCQVSVRPEVWACQHQWETNPELWRECQILARPYS